MKRKKDLDVENLNNVIELGRKILKVSLIIVILATILLGFTLFKEFKIGSVLLNILEVASPLFIGFIIAWLLNPAVTYLQKKNVKRGLGSVFVFVMFLIVIFIIFKVMIPMLYVQINSFIDMLPTLYSVIGDFIAGSFQKLSSTGLDIAGVQDKIFDSIQAFSVNLTTKLPNIILNVITGVFSSIWSFVLGLIIGFYLLIDFDSMKKIFNIVPKKNRNYVIKVSRDLDDTCKDFVLGTLLIAFIIFIVTSIFFAIIGIPSPMLFGLICGITNIIPYIGPWIGGAIVTIVGFTVSPLVGVLAIAVAFGAQQLDGMVLQPIVMGKTMKLHPVTIMVGLLIFGYFFGIVGMIVATPCIACFKVLYNHFDSKYKLKDKIANHNTGEGK